jgi:hypothetical protein
MRIDERADDSLALDWVYRTISSSPEYKSDLERAEHDEKNSFIGLSVVNRKRTYGESNYG